MAKKSRSGPQRKSKSNRVPWDQMRGNIEKRKKRFKIVMISVLSVVAVSVIYLAAVILFSDPPAPPGDDEALAAGLDPKRGEEDKLNGGGTDPERAGSPEEGDPLAVTPEEGEEPKEPEVSSLFEDGLVESGMKAINRGEDLNFFALLTLYAKEIEEGDSREALKKIYRLINEGKPEEAFGEITNLEVPVRIREAVRAVVLTRLLKKTEAGEAFSRADNNTQPPEFNFEWGLYHLEAGNPAAAYAQFSIGARKNPQNPSMQFAAAGSAFDVQNWEAAVKHVDLGTKAARDMPPRFGLLAAEAEVRLGKPLEAIKRCRAVLEDKPAANNVRIYLARVLAANGQFEESLEAFHEVEKDMPDSPLIKVELAKSYLANNDKEAAVKVAEEFVNSRPDDLRLKAWYADILASAEKFEEAGKLLEEIGGELKANERAVLESIIALRKKDFLQAAAALEPYHKADLNLAIRWASFKFAGGQSGIDIQQVLEDHRLNATLWKVVAAHAAKYSLWKMTAFCCDKAIALGDESVDTLNNWAWCTIQDSNQFDLERVSWACEKALSASPGNPSVLHTYGQALFVAGQVGRCGELLANHKEAVDSSAHLCLLQARVYVVLKAEPSARRYFERTLELMDGVKSWQLDQSREEIEGQLAKLAG